MLPTKEQERLLFLLHHDPVRLKRRIASLRHHGWTVRDIAAPLDKSPSTIQYWSTASRLDDESDVPFPVTEKTPAYVTRRRSVEVPTSTLDYLRGLTANARRANRHTQEGTKEYFDSKELTMMLGFLVKYRMVPIRYLARELDISPSAISQRIKDGEAKKWV